MVLSGRFSNFEGEAKKIIAVGPKTYGYSDPISSR
jgi:hypothetical protein